MATRDFEIGVCEIGVYKKPLSFKCFINALLNVTIKMG